MRERQEPESDSTRVEIETSVRPLGWLCPGCVRETQHPDDRRGASVTLFTDESGRRILGVCDRHGALVFDLPLAEILELARASE